MHLEMAKKSMGIRSVGDHTVPVCVDFKSRGKKPNLSLTYRRNRNETDQVHVFDLDQWI